jgi:hypothetical protein
MTKPIKCHTCNHAKRQCRWLSKTSSSKADRVMKENPGQRSGRSYETELDAANPESNPVHTELKTQNSSGLSRMLSNFGLLLYIATEWQAGDQFRLLIPKARQHGITTLMTCIGYCQTALPQDRFSAHHRRPERKSHSIFDKAILMHENVHPMIRTEIKRILMPKNSFFSETRSVMRIGTAGNEDLGRSQTYQFFSWIRSRLLPERQTVMERSTRMCPGTPGTP